MSFLDVFGQEVVGVEFLCVIAPDVFSAVQSVEVDEQCDPGWNLELADLNWSLSLATDDFEYRESVDVHEKCQISHLAQPDKAATIL
jgi:hypothetical protein